MYRGPFTSIIGLLAGLSITLAGIYPIGVTGGRITHAREPGAEAPGQRQTSDAAFVTQETDGAAAYHIPENATELRLTARAGSARGVLLLRFKGRGVHSLTTESDGLVVQMRGTPAPGADVRLLVTDLEGVPVQEAHITPAVVLAAPPGPEATATPQPQATPTRPVATPAAMTRTQASQEETRDVEAKDRDSKEKSDREDKSKKEQDSDRREVKGDRQDDDKDKDSGKEKGKSGGDKDDDDDREREDGERDDEDDDRDEDGDDD
jgi:hypothetical protein